MPWRWIDGSVVPSSSIRLRMTSIDCATSEDMRSLMPSGVSAMVDLAVGGLAEGELRRRRRPAKSELEMVFCSVCERGARRVLLGRVGQLDGDRVRARW